jgi:hypothetical protein
LRREREAPWRSNCGDGALLSRNETKDRSTMRTPNGPLFKTSEIVLALAFAAVFIAVASLQVVY